MANYKLKYSGPELEDILDSAGKVKKEWETAKNEIVTNNTELLTKITGKQGKLTAGVGILIDPETDTISGTYVGGVGISIVGNVINNTGGGSGGDGIGIATSEVAGIIKIGDDFNITEDGTLSIYKKIEYTTNPSVSPSEAEVGSTVNSVSISFAANSTPKSVSINDVVMSSKTSPITLTGEWSSSKTFTIKLTDIRDQVASKNATLTFKDRIYYGSVSGNKLAATGVDADFIKGLSSKLSTSRVLTTTTSGGEYFFYLAIPTSMGNEVVEGIKAIKWTDGAGTYTLNILKESVSVTNTYGKTISYNVFVSGQKIPSGTSLTTK